MTTSNTVEVVRDGASEVSSRWRLPDALLVVVCTSMVYVTAAAYEAGLAAAFQIDPGLIEVRLMGPILLVGLAWLAIAIMVIVISAIVGAALGERPLDFLSPAPNESPLLTRIRAPIWLLMYLFALRLVSGTTLDPWLPRLTYAGLAAIGLWAASPLYRYRNVIDRIERMRLANRRGHGGQSISGVLRASRFGWLIPAIMLSFGSLSIAFMFGYRNSKEQTTFDITSQDTVVLAIYGDRAITATFDRRQKQLHPVYQVLRLDVPGVTFHTEDVGPLSFSR